MESFKSQLVLEKYNCSKFTSVVLDIEPILFAFYDCMTSANTYIVNSNLTFVTTSQFEFTLFWRHCEKMNISGSVLIERHWLKQDVVRVCTRCYFINQINNFVNSFLDFKGVWIHLFTNFALKSFPIEWSNILVSGTRWLFLLLRQNPRFQTLEMN